jgi:hypothetical protein
MTGREMNPCGDRVETADRRAKGDAHLHGGPVPEGLRPAFYVLDERTPTDAEPTTTRR